MYNALHKPTGIITKEDLDSMVALSIYNRGYSRAVMFRKFVMFSITQQIYQGFFFIVFFHKAKKAYFMD